MTGVPCDFLMSQKSGSFLQNRQSKELDVEVASMIELAETASIATGSLKRPQKDEAASSHSETSLTKSTENLIPKASSVS